MLLVPYLLKPVPTAETMTAKPTRKGALMGDGNLTADEKKARQAKHRLEEAEARNRVKERKARTRRLIQEGALLESIAPAVREMDMDSLKQELLIRMQGLT